MHFEVHFSYIDVHFSLSKYILLDSSTLFRCSSTFSHFDLPILKIELPIQLPIPKFNYSLTTHCTKTTTHYCFWTTHFEKWVIEVEKWVLETMYNVQFPHKMSYTFYKNG